MHHGGETAGLRPGFVGHEQVDVPATTPRRSPSTEGRAKLSSRSRSWRRRRRRWQKPRHRRCWPRTVLASPRHCCAAATVIQGFPSRFRGLALAAIGALQLGGDQGANFSRAEYSNALEASDHPAMRTSTAPVVGRLSGVAGRQAARVSRLSSFPFVTNRANRAGGGTAPQSPQPARSATDLPAPPRSSRPCGQREIPDIAGCCGFNGDSLAAPAFEPVGRCFTHSDAADSRRYDRKHNVP